MFDTKDTQLLQTWNRILTLQVDYTFLWELAAYFSAPTFHQAKTIGDLGCGNGAYLQRLAARFPDKQYVGLDSSAEFIQLARAGNSLEQVEFRVGDIFELEDEFDFLILRAVIQHIPDSRGLLAKLRSLVKPGGSILLSDAHEEFETFFHPPAPLMEGMFDALNAQARAQGGDRQVLARIGELVDEFDDLSVASDLPLLMPSTLPGLLPVACDLYEQLVELYARTHAADVDFDAVRREWNTWRDLPGAYTHIGMRLVRIDRTNAPA